MALFELFPKVRLLEVAETGAIGAGIVSIQAHVPFAFVDEAERNACIVLHNSAAALQDEGAHFGEVLAMGEVGGGLDEGGNRFERVNVGLEGRVGAQRRVAEVHREVDETLRAGSGAAEVERDGVVAQGRGAAFLFPAGGEPARVVQRRGLVAEHIAVHARQLHEQDREDAVGDLAAELGIHVGGDEKAAAEQTAEGAANARQVAFEIQLADGVHVGQSAGRFEAHEDVCFLIGEEGVGGEDVRAAEGVKESGGLEGMAGDGLLLEVAQLWKPVLLEAGPHAVEVDAVPAPGWVFFEAGERRAGGGFDAAEEAGYLIDGGAARNIEGTRRFLLSGGFPATGSE